MTTGKTREETERNIKEAIEGHIETFARVLATRSQSPRPLPVKSKLARDETARLRRFPTTFTHSSLGSIRSAAKVSRTALV